MLYCCRSTNARVAEICAANTAGDGNPVSDGCFGEERRVHHVQRDPEDLSSARGYSHSILEHAAAAASRASHFHSSRLPEHNSDHIYCKSHILSLVFRL